MPITSILDLPISLNVENKPKLLIYENNLGDGYSATEPGVSRIRDEWTVKSPAVTETDKDAVITIFEQLNGFISFSWQPYPTYPIKQYTCKEFSFKALGNNGDGILYEFNATFVEDILAECVGLLLEFNQDDILTMLDGADLFLETYTKNTKPLMLNSSGLTVNSFHDVLGRGGYFPASAGTTEGQAVGVRACIQAYRVTGDMGWLNRAVLLGEALIDNYYPIDLPSLEDAPSTLYVPHWLINVKESFPSKGASKDNPASYGYFGNVFEFVNGIATIPGGILADVYKVYSTDGSLLWENVNAPLVSGTEYAVNYWVSNLELKGVNYRFNPTYTKPGSTPIVITNETPGKIVLSNTSFSGFLIVVYSDYSGSIINPGDKFEADPMWRPLQSNESLGAFDSLFWLSDAYQLLFEETEDTRWQRAYLATQYTILAGSEVTSVSYFYKKQDFYDSPLSWPGSQVLWINNSNKGTVSRINGGAKDQWLQINTPTPVGEFPSVELQNFAVVVNAYSNTEISIEVECSQSTILEIVLSAGVNTFDSSELYKVFFVVPANTIVNRVFNIREFIKYATGFNLGDVLVGGNQLLVWHPTMIPDSTYSYNSGGVATNELVETDYIYIDPNTGIDTQSTVLVSRFTLLRGDFAGGGLVLLDEFNNSLGSRTSSPPRLVYRLSGSSVRLIIIDANDERFFMTINPSNGWTTIKQEWNAFVALDNPNATPDTLNQIKGIQFEAISTTLGAVLDVYYVGDNEPPRLDLPVKIIKSSLVSRIDSEHTLYCGDFKPVNNDFDGLPYSPGVVPFTVNVQNGIIESWQGNPYCGYQSPATWVMYGLQDRASQVFQFLSDSQDDYARQSIRGDMGLFSPVYNWPLWDSLTSPPETLNQFTFEGTDPNTQWSAYAFRVFADAAKAWYLGGPSLIAEKVVMRCAKYLNDNYYIRRSIAPITDIPPIGKPAARYPEPHAASLILRGALYANLSGGDPSITLPLIIHTYRYIKSQYVDTGLMEGSFSKDQPSFTEGSNEYKEYFAFWHFEILESLAELQQLREQLVSPPCGLTFLDSITIPLAVSFDSTNTTFDSTQVTFDSNLTN